MSEVFRILNRFKITGRGIVYTIERPKDDSIGIGDILFDLHGNRLKVNGIEMFKYDLNGKSIKDMPMGILFERLDNAEVKGNILVKDIQKVNFIFCSHPLYEKQVDPDYKEEYQAAGLNHACVLFSYEDMQEGKLSLFGEDVSGLTIYRGWMMKPEMYKAFYEALEERGIILINTPEEYNRYHLLPEWYPEFRDDTIESVWTDSTEIERIRDLFKRKEGAFIVKDYVKSNFVTVDLARKEDGSLVIMEFGDGQVSGLQQLEAEKFYRKLFIK